MWAAATPREEAITQVLNAVPEGWTAALLSKRLKPLEEEAHNLKPGEVREIMGNRKNSAHKTTRDQD